MSRSAKVKQKPGGRFPGSELKELAAFYKLIGEQQLIIIVVIER